jgi:hypothetical protein
MYIASDFTSIQESQFLKLITSNFVPVEIIKEKKGVATLIRFNDQRYVVQHPSHIRANQNLKGRKEYTK